MSARHKSQVAALVALALLLLGSARHPALANGDGSEIFRDSDGTYELIVRVQPDVPAVGVVHMTFEPLRAGTAVPVVDAEIGVVARDETGADRYAVRALNTPRAERYYDANLTIESPGDWTLVVEIESRTVGQTTFLVPLQVREQSLAPGSYTGTAVFLVVLGLIVGGTALVWRQSRRALRER